MIHVEPLHDDALIEVAALFNHANANLPYHWPLDADAFRTLVLLNQGEPHARLGADPEGWLTARVDTRLVGFVHCDIGRLITDDRAERRGFIRTIALLPDSQAVVVKSLLAAAEMYFRARNVSDVTAYDMHTGYACLLAGRGMLPGHHFPIMTALAAAGFEIGQRWQLSERVYEVNAIEYVPQLSDLRLSVVNRAKDGFSLFLSQRAEPLAELHIDFLAELSRHGDMPTASLQTLQVAEGFRRKRLGSWLMQRAANELLTRGYQRLVVDINHRDVAGQGLLLSLGFEELPLSGYTFAKRLA